MAIRAVLIDPGAPQVRQSTLNLRITENCELSSIRPEGKL